MIWRGTDLTQYLTFIIIKKQSAKVLHMLEEERDLNPFRKESLKKEKGLNMEVEPGQTMMIFIIILKEMMKT